MKLLKKEKLVDLVEKLNQDDIDKIVKEKLIPSYGNDRFEEKYSTEIFTKMMILEKLQKKTKKKK